MSLPSVLCRDCGPLYEVPTSRIYDDKDGKFSGWKCVLCENVEFRFERKMYPGCRPGKPKVLKSTIDEVRKEFLNHCTLYHDGRTTARCHVCNSGPYKAGFIFVQLLRGF